MSIRKPIHAPLETVALTEDAFEVHRYKLQSKISQKRYVCTHYNWIINFQASNINLNKNLMSTVVTYVNQRF